MNKKLQRRELLVGFAGFCAFCLWNGCSSANAPQPKSSKPQPTPEQKGSQPPESQDPIGDKVRAIIVEQLGVNEKQLVPTARLIEDLGADSLDSVELIMAFEEAFDLEIPDTVCLRTVGDVIAYIKTHAKKLQRGAKATRDERLNHPPVN